MESVLSFYLRGFWGSNSDCQACPEAIFIHRATGSFFISTYDTGDGIIVYSTATCLSARVGLILFSDNVDYEQ